MKWLFQVPKYGCLTLVVIVTAWVFVPPAARHLLMKTVAEEKKTYKYGRNTEYGYSVQKNRWARDGYRIRLWAGSSLNLTLDDDYKELTRVRTHRWLAFDRVVFLEYEGVYNDSAPGAFQSALLYDFEAVALYCYRCPVRVWSPDGRDNRELSKDQFQDIVRHYESIR